MEYPGGMHKEKLYSTLHQETWKRNFGDGGRVILCLCIVGQHRCMRYRGLK